MPGTTACKICTITISLNSTWEDFCNIVMVWPLLLPFSSLFLLSSLAPPSIHLQPQPTLSAHPLPSSLCTNSKAYSCNHAMSTVGLASDWYWTCLDPVPMPRGTIYIPFIHSSNLSDLLSLPTTGNCLLFLINPFLCITHCGQDIGSF